MQTTKSQILAHLKRTGGSTVDELATALGLARMTVRQHLAALERDELIASREVRRLTGRPHYLFTLSDKGEESFPKRYDRLAELILEEASLLDSAEIAGLTPSEKKRLLFRKLVDRLARQYAHRVEDRSLAERVAAVADLLQEEGGFAEWRKIDNNYEILNYNCVYRKVVAVHDDFCDWHVELIRRLLDGQVKCLQFMSQGAECCRFIVSGQE